MDACVLRSEFKVDDSIHRRYLDEAVCVPPEEAGQLTDEQRLAKTRQWRQFSDEQFAPVATPTLAAATETKESKDNEEIQVLSPHDLDWETGTIFRGQLRGLFALMVF